jgi:3-oxoacid CoA-transferase subunit A
MELNSNDTIILCGDDGLNYHRFYRNSDIKRKISNLNGVKFLLVQGNHGCPNGDLLKKDDYGHYHLVEEDGNKFIIQSGFENLKFMLNGETYNIEGNSFLVVGGAYSVDKEYRLINHYSWWANEQPTEQEKQLTIENCVKHDYTFDYVLTHTVPLKYEPKEVFLPFVDQSKVDKSTEIWLDKLENNLNYKKWYAGHYHIDKKVDKLHLLYNDIVELGS